MSASSGSPGRPHTVTGLAVEGGAMGWLIVLGLLLVGASALLSDLCLHHTAVISARIQAILLRSERDSPP